MLKKERPVMIESGSHRNFLLAQDVWDFCVALGAECHQDPREVLSRLIWAGKAHAEVEKKGAEVFVRFEGRVKQWKLFNGNGGHPLDK